MPDLILKEAKRLELLRHRGAGVEEAEDEYEDEDGFIITYLWSWACPLVLQWPSYCECCELPRGCVHEALSLGIMLTNRQSHAEAAAILYGENEFHVNCQDKEAVRYLKSLPPATAALLVFLNVSLESHGSFHPVSLSQPSFSGFQEAWMDLCSWLEHSLTPDRVNFTFDCNVSDVPTVLRITSGLYHLPTFRTLKLDFDRSLRENVEMKDVLEGLCKRLTTTSRQESSFAAFPFNSLPAELRMEVLRHTSLIGCKPTKCWQGSDSYCMGFGLPLGLHEIAHTCSKCGRCCKTCSQSFLGRCYCSSMRFSQISSTCTCLDRRLPRDLLQTSKQMRSEATDVLFSRNRFAVTGSVVEVIATLRNAPLEHMRLIRDLVLVIYKAGHREPDWCELFETLKTLCHYDLWAKVYFDNHQSDELGHESTVFVSLIEKLQQEAPHSLPKRITVLADKRRHGQHRAFSKAIIVYGPHTHLYTR